MGKHAFLIMCHKSDYNLLALIKSIDDPRNDIYIMVDAKVKNFDFKFVKTAAQYSIVNFVPRIKIYWGGYSQIRGEMILFKTAEKSGGGGVRLLPLIVRTRFVHKNARLSA